MEHPVGVIAPKPCPEKQPPPAGSSSRDEGLEHNPRYVQDPPVDNSTRNSFSQAGRPQQRQLEIFCFFALVRHFVVFLASVALVLYLRAEKHLALSTVNSRVGEFGGTGSVWVYKKSFASRVNRYIRALGEVRVDPLGATVKGLPG